MFSKSIQVLRLAPRLPNTPNAFRKLSSANALQNSAGATDPIQKLFADKVILFDIVKCILTTLKLDYIESYIHIELYNDHIIR